MNNEIYVIGHVNPDTDSICSAIAYARLKQKITGGEYKAKRAGQINSETKFVLERFGVKTPSYLSDVRTQVRDIEIRRTKGVNQGISLKIAWAYMKENNVVTLPIVDNKNHLEGLITVGDIAKSYMDVYDNRILTKAQTPCINIVETLEGELVVGNEEDVFAEGKVLIAAANPDLMENYIEQGDIVILGNRYESQLCAIEMNASCIVVCDGANVSKTITKLAQNNNCKIIKTPYDTFTATRLINQSIPIRYFMTDQELLYFTNDDFIEDIRGIMAKKRHRDFPILTKDGYYCGMISRRNLLGAKRKQMILVDHNEKSQAVDGLEDAEILEIIDHHRLGSLETMNPVFFRNQPLGCTATIIYQMYLENGIEVEPPIAGLLCSAILSDTLVYRSPTCTEIDRASAEALANIAGIEVEQYAKEMFAAGSNLTSKSPEEIFYQDFKKFIAGDVTFGVGQINSMTQDELEAIKEKLVPYMQKAYHDHGVAMLFFMLTNIMDSSTELLYQGNGARELLLNAFSLGKDTDEVYLSGVVSRKKQIIPALMQTLVQDNN
ncbi:manganese-dependent inorganic pyrophosphatase [Anaerocolumna cellulosilytica]|uniref:inorganic diphosphatase n=1 Tax=Anaerocolumna cellulosilytica TaxID=433286 RepID=A0A6S6R688_9FIRM|nr:putative manganese-dependent inorganic diphosphatase [Anaerocolumna cellulosilytica]MBB5195849.1 manganese-dependent inorganic pyrophosphatase [Anaerocolumna cellulosilytica]BCJ96859.1 manganese-dependent inorganic pyrophosphatase [Anaerocolumna cellulosilytica]